MNRWMNQKEEWRKNQGVMTYDDTDANDIGEGGGYGGPGEGEIAKMANEHDRDELDGHAEYVDENHGPCNAQKLFHL